MCAPARATHVRRCCVERIARRRNPGDPARCERRHEARVRVRGTRRSAWPRRAPSTGDFRGRGEARGGPWSLVDGNGYVVVLSHLYLVILSNFHPRLETHGAVSGRSRGASNEFAPSTDAGEITPKIEDIRTFIPAPMAERENYALQPLRSPAPRGPCCGGVSRTHSSRDLRRDSCDTMHPVDSLS